MVAGNNRLSIRTLPFLQGGGSAPAIRARQSIITNKEEHDVDPKAVVETNPTRPEEMAEEKENSMIIEEFEIEELSVDGICGVY